MDGSKQVDTTRSCFQIRAKTYQVFFYKDLKPWLATQQIYLTIFSNSQNVFVDHWVDIFDMFRYMIILKQIIGKHWEHIFP